MLTIYDDSYSALLVSIFNEVDPDIAFDIIQKGKSKRFIEQHTKCKITSDDVKEMIRLKKTMTYKQIGAKYGISDKNAYSYMKRLKNTERR